MVNLLSVKGFFEGFITDYQSAFVLRPALITFDTFMIIFVYFMVALGLIHTLMLIPFFMFLHSNLTKTANKSNLPLTFFALLLVLVFNRVLYV